MVQSKCYPLKRVAYETCGHAVTAAKLKLNMDEHKCYSKLHLSVTIQPLAFSWRCMDSVVLFISYKLASFFKFQLHKIENMNSYNLQQGQKAYVRSGG
jgi:hypothetical protein